MTTWFTAARMRKTGIAIVVFDILLALTWGAGSIYILVNFSTDCFRTELLIFHFFILCHFILGGAVSSLVAEIDKEEMRYRDKGKPLPATLPYEVYSPWNWSFSTIISTFGDATLLTAGILAYQLLGGSDECQQGRLAHIIYDAIALVISLITDIWFILFAIYTISSERRRNLKKREKLERRASQWHAGDI